MFRGDKFAALKVEARAGDVLTQIPFWTNPSIFIYSVGSSRMEREVEEWRGGGAEERRSGGGEEGGVESEEWMNNKNKRKKTDIWKIFGWIPKNVKQRTCECYVRQIWLL